MRINALIAAVIVFMGIAVGASGDAAATAPAVAVPPPVEGYPIGWCIRGKPEVFDQAKRLGYEYVELAMQDLLPLPDADFDKLHDALRAAWLKADAGYNVVPKEIMLVGPEADVGKQEEHLGKLLERSQALGLEYLVLNAGASWKIPQGYDKDKAWGELVDFCKRFAVEAGGAGITVLVEPVRSTDSNQLTTIAEAVKLVDAVNDKHFAMLVDYSFLRIQKDDVNELVKAGARVKHIWISNPANKRTYAMDDGESDYASFFAALKKMGYRGGLSVHGGPMTTIPQDAPRAIAFLRRQAAELANP